MKLAYGYLSVCAPVLLKLGAVILVLIASILMYAIPEGASSKLVLTMVAIKLVVCISALGFGFNNIEKTKSPKEINMFIVLYLAIGVISLLSLLHFFSS